MKIPKIIKRHCPYCKKHTEHTVSIAKKKGQGSVHTQSRSSFTRLRARVHGEVSATREDFPGLLSVQEKCLEKSSPRRQISVYMQSLQQAAFAERWQKGQKSGDHLGI